MGIDEFDKEDPTTRPADTDPPQPRDERGRFLPVDKPQAIPIPRDKTAWWFVFVLFACLMVWVWGSLSALTRVAREKRRLEAAYADLQHQFVEAKMKGQVGTTIPVPPTITLPSKIVCTLDDPTIEGIRGMLQHAIDRNEQRPTPVFGPCR